VNETTVSAELDFAASFRADRRSTEELLAFALAQDADPDKDGFWEPIRALQHRLPQVLESIIALSTSRDEKSRDIAATLLGQCCIPAKFAPDHCTDILLSMLAQENADKVLPSIIFALGQLKDPRLVGPVADLRAHTDARVRLSVVSALGCHEDKRAIEALIVCSGDQDRDVRNWATFGLGSLIETDTPAIRGALFARLGEADDEIRGEAIVGLLRRGDVRAAGAMLGEIQEVDTNILRDWVLMLEAAEEVVRLAKASGAAVWRPVLERLAACRIGNQDEIQAALNLNAPPQK